MKLREFEKDQNFESLTEFTKNFRCSHCWIIEIDQCKLTIPKEEDWFELQKNLNYLQLCDLAPQHMIKIEINQIMKLDKRFPTLQKWVKSKAWCKRYCTLKFFVHQIQRNEMFSAFVASPMTLCPISPEVKFEMISPPRGRTQNRCEIAPMPLPYHNCMPSQWITTRGPTIRTC